jgi:acetyl-CoA carboxylase biotin carboxylase subunit
MTTIHKLLVANRGEIARRIFRTCRALGVETVAVFSDADAAMPFVREADEAVRIGPAPSAESYLKTEAILDAAKRTGADAIHPGYGFLSENAAFARAVAEAGLIFVGPTPEAIESMGSKKEAKALVAAAGVPVVPGYDGADQDPKVLAAKAVEIGFPVLLKASAGGGGKGMKRVDREEELEDAIASAKREGVSAFGDGTLLVEKYVEKPRHVEIQIFGDAEGNVIHLFERECSIQRRHQKILEEAPSPALDEGLRKQMGEAAIKAGAAIGYRNAGTVEFILGQDGSFYFLEVNTRLQVEHPVTEAITGLDLVALQLRVAEGKPLGVDVDALEPRGAAIEARIYAEDPAGDFLPQSGPVLDWHLPPMEGVRVDGGVETGNEVGIHYDPMMAKVIAEGADRSEALRRLRRALRALSVQGLTTNRRFLLQVIEHPAFVAGELHTHFIDEHLSEALDAALESRAIIHALVAATLHGHEERRDRAIVPGVPSGFRNNPHTPQRLSFRVGDDEHTVSYRHRFRTPGRFDVTIGESTHEAVVLQQGERSIRFELDGHRMEARVVPTAERVFVQIDGVAVPLGVVPRFPDLSAEVPAGACIAPMPGKVVEVRVAEGDTVTEGQVLLVMEAMKMEHQVVAPEAGTVTALHAEAGEQVEADAVLAIVGSDD